MVTVTVERGAVPAWAAHDSGLGYSDGYGDGYGDGSGEGYGDSCYGDGYSAGSGYGYGSGCVDGDGYSDGSPEYWRATIAAFASRWPSVQQARLVELQQQGALIAFWRSGADGRAVNGGRCQPVKPGDVHTERGPLRNQCGAGQLHATLMPTKWQGERWWIVALIGEVRGDATKYWALKREYLGECLWRPSDGEGRCGSNGGPLMDVEIGEET